MKSALNKLAIHTGLYNIVYKGEIDICRTYFGGYFILGVFELTTLEKCIKVVEDNAANKVWEEFKETLTKSNE